MLAPATLILAIAAALSARQIFPHAWGKCPAQPGDGGEQPHALALGTPHLPTSRPPHLPASPPDLAREARIAGAAGDLDRAADLFTRHLAVTPSDFQSRYNLARVEARRGRTDAALTHLRAAIDHGFDDLRRLRRDTWMDPVRAMPAYADIERTWSATLEAQLARNLEDARRFAPQAIVVRDERLRVVYLSSWDAPTLESARAELALLADWAATTVFPDLFDPAQNAIDPWAVIVLPDAEGFDRWTREYFGAQPMAAPGFATVGGAYVHDQKRLVARDLGSTLRHEFMHVLHWRMSTRVGQIHPIWLQEGLCALVEDYDLRQGRPVPAVSYRTNTAKRLARIGSLLPLSDLIAVPRERFLGDRPMAHYAQARAMFLFLERQNALPSFYAAFVDQLAATPTDPTRAAVAALEAALADDIRAIDDRYRAFVRALPDAAEQIKPGDASLGVEIDTGAGDGPRVTAIRRDDDQPLKVGDTILAINQRPVRDTPDLVRALAALTPNQPATLTIRRAGRTLDLPVTLKARE